MVREEGAAALAQTERLAEVVSQLLGRTRRAARGVPSLLPIDDVIAQQVIEWDPAFRRANRKLEVTGEKGLTAYVTPGALAQIIATLLDNALVHGAGTVAIRTSRTPKSVVVEVRDEGKGVPHELVPRIFERNVSGRPGGTGLGLALARDIATAEGGQRGAGPAAPGCVRGVPAEPAARQRRAPGGDRPSLSSASPAGDPRDPRGVVGSAGTRLRRAPPRQRGSAGRWRGAWPGARACQVR